MFNDDLAREFGRQLPPAPPPSKAQFVSGLRFAAQMSDKAADETLIQQIEAMSETSFVEWYRQNWQRTLNHG